MAGPWEQFKQEEKPWEMISSKTAKDTHPAQLFAKKEDITEDVIAAGKGFVSSLAPSAAAIAGAGKGAQLAPAGPFGIGKVVGAIGGALVGGYLGGKAQEMVLPEDVKKDLAKSAKEHPKATFAGELASGAPFFGPGKAQMAERAIMGGVGGGAELARQLASDEKVDVAKIAMATGAGATLTKATKLGGKIAPAFKDTSEHLASTGFRDKETGEIIKTGPKHPEEPKQNPKYEQGFVTEDGQFLNRKEAHERAIKIGQIKKDHKLERPEEGLHSGDLRANKDRKFSTEEAPGLPKFANGIPVYEGKTGRTRPDGTPIAATAFSKDGKVEKIIIDQEQLNKDFANKVWTQPKMQGVEALPEDAFKSPAEYTAFVLAHEREHSLQNFSDFHKEQIKQQGFLPKSEKQLRGEYEDMMNKRAMENIKHPITLQGAGEMIGKTLNHIRANVRNAKIFRKNIEESLPNNVHRETVTMALENPTLQKGVPGLKPYIEHVQSFFDELGQRAKKEGVIDGMLSNYVTHVLDWRGFKGSEAMKQAILDKIMNAPKESKLVKDFTQHRYYSTLQELETVVAGTGIKVEKDIAKIVEAYSNSMETAILHKKMIDKLKMTDAPNGKPYLVPVSAEALKEKYVPFQGVGAKPLEGLLVHPDLAPTMGQMFRQNDPNIFLRAMGAFTHLTKALNTVGSLFHATSLGQAHLLADPANALRELFSGGKGVRQAVAAFKSGQDAGMSTLIDGFMREGLVANTEDIQRTIIPEVGAFTDRVISKYGPETKIATRATEALDKHVLQKLNGFTWDYMHTGQKLNLAIHLFTKAKAKNPNIPDEELQKQIGRFVNETFGGLNWADIANQVQNKYAKAFAERAANIQGREWAQILFFAPDWTVSTLRAFTSAFPKEINKPQNWDLKGGIKGMWNPTKQEDFARRYVLNTAIAYFTILNAINYAMSKHFIWDNKDRTRIDLGDGTTMQAAKHSMEFAEWIQDPMKTFGNKLGFVPKATYIEISGHMYPGEHAPKVKPAYEGYGGMEVGKAEAIATAALPFQAGSAVQAPTGEKAKRALWSTLGLPIYGLTKEERAIAIKKGKAEARKRRAEKKRRGED